MFEPRYSTIKFNVLDGTYWFLRDEKFLNTQSFALALLINQKYLFGINEKWSFNFNIAYRKDKYYSDNIYITQENLNLPIYFKYCFLNSKLTPSIDFGINNTFYLKTGIKANPGFFNTDNSVYYDRLVNSIGFYQIGGTLGIGLEFIRDRITYIINLKYEIGSGINDLEYTLNYLSSTTNSFGLKLGIKYNLNP